MFKNLKIKIGSLLLAFIFWFFVASSYDQVRSFNYDIKIQPIGLNNEFVILHPDLMPKTKIYYRATAKNVSANSLKIEDFSSTIQLKGLNEGFYKAPVIVATTHPNIEIVDFSPKEVAITIEKKISKEFIPEFISKGKAASGYKLNEIISPLEKVEIAGAESIIEQVVKVEAEIELIGSESTDTIKKAKFQALTSDNRALTEVEFNPSSINIELDVVLDEETKTVGIIPDLDKISLQDGYFIKSVRIEPPTAKIRGKQDDLNNLNHLETIRLTINNLDQNYETSLDLELPENISLIAPIDNQVTLTLEVASLDYQKEVSAFIQTKNLSDSYYLEYDRPITVTLTGTPEKLDNLDENDISITLDFDQINYIGKKTIELKKGDFVYPQEISIVEHSPKVWEVTVVKK